jgi:hypothetical protein
MNEGWKCPQCGKIHAPWVPSCDACAMTTVVKVPGQPPNTGTPAPIYPVPPFEPFKPFVEVTPYTPWRGSGSTPPCDQVPHFQQELQNEPHYFGPTYHIPLGNESQQNRTIVGYDADPQQIAFVPNFSVDPD